MMPKKDGVQTLTEIRAAGNVTPVIMLTAKAEVEDRIVGLDAGADDYLTKPFAVRELLARIRSVTRRNTNFMPDLLRFGNIELNVETQELKGENTIRLSAKETKLLKYFLLNTGKELMTPDIFAYVWNDETDESEDIVWVYISYLRQKLAAVHGAVSLDGEQNGAFVLKAV